jgi:hypothetical protein
VTTSGPILLRSLRCRLLWPILLLVYCPLQSSRAQTPPPHTAADFEAARTTTETSLTSARKALRQNAGLRATAEDAASRLATLSQSRDASPVALRTLSDIDSILQSLLPPATTSAITDALTQAASTLNDPKNALTTAKTQLDTLKSSDDFKNMDFDLQNRVSQTLIDCQTVLDQIGKDDGLNSDSNNKLKASLAKVLAQALAVTDGFAKALKPLSDLGDVDPASATDDQKKAVLKTTGKYLPIYVDIICLKKPYTEQWTTVSTHLKTLDSTIDPSAVQTNLGKLDQAPVSNIPTFLPHWLDVVKQMPSAETAKLQRLISDVDADAPANTASAVEELRTANSLRDSFKGVEDSWTKLLTALDCLGTAGAPLSSDTVTASLAVFTKASHALFGALSRLQEAIAGDFSQFEADQQQLFYFTDVPRLMQMLNPGAYEIGGIQGAQEQAAVQRHKLAQAELDLAAAQADVNTYQTRLMQLPEELKQARADARKQDQVYGNTANRLAILGERLGASTTALQTANSAASAAPTDKAAQQAAQRAQQDKDRLTTQNADAQRDNANAQHDKDVADQKLKAAEDEQTGIPAQIEKAKLALSAAQTAVSQRRQESLLAAQAESDAFALARDNTPYWFAPATGISKDAARRVEMYGTNDSKIIYLRGKREDLEEVKNIIAGIDKPAPQARVTLWSLQLNYTNDTKGNSVQKVNEALLKIEDRLAEIRIRMAASVSLLRDSVNAQLNTIVQDSHCSTADECRLARITGFYDPQVLLRLLYNNVDPQTGQTISHWTTPDPAGTTTLGEALLILSLAKPSIRMSIFDGFLTRIQAFKTSGNWATWLEQQERKHGQGHDPQDNNISFRTTRRALNLDATPSGTEANELTSAQLEIVRALESAAYTRLVEQVVKLSAQLGTVNNALTPLCAEIGPLNIALSRSTPAPCNEVQAQYPGAPIPPPQTAEDTRRLTAQRDLLSRQIYHHFATIHSLSGEIAPLLWYLWRNYGVLPGAFEHVQDPDHLATEIGRDFEKRSSLATTTRKALLSRHPIQEATAREAAADEMLKEMMTAMEEDLDRFFVRPGIAELRDDIMRQGNLQVGILQRTSMLATNRLSARVDPRSSAQLALGEQEDILQSVTQLAQIYMAAQTGGALGTLNALNNLKSQTKEPPQEVYGLTTGSTFKITPIFDPSGQALRFKFDYVAANNVTEPNGTMNAQLPRIERHTVNTEVQISNMELREISRYEANSRLGIPTKYWGGIPLLKDLLEPYPNVRRWVPLIGWFVRKSGSGAASQESLIFGQTTIYPTIGDIAELLTGNVNAAATALQ